MSDSPSQPDSPAPTPAVSTAQLKRQVGVGGAILLGLGSIIGTGAFFSIALAADQAGSQVLLAIALAGVLALFNAMGSAQLAAAHPVSGGTYEYGYRLFGWPVGFTAGWMFLVAKSASAATAALAVASILVSRAGFDPGSPWRVVVALVLISGFTSLAAGGLKRSNKANTIIVAITIGSLALFILACLPYALRQPEFAATVQALDGGGSVPGSQTTGLWSLLSATALIFVAYTGYGRIATLGEEVHNPRRSIPIAIFVTLGVSATLYLGVAYVMTRTLNAAGLHDVITNSKAPLVVVANIAADSWVAWLVGLGAVIALTGVLLNLLLGLSRVVLAMGRRGDLPPATTRLNAEGTSPTTAVWVVGVIIAVIALNGSIVTSWSLSATTVLIYYGLTNLCALGLPREQRFYPRIISVLGLVGCLGLAWWVDMHIWITALIILAVGLLWRFVSTSLRRQWLGLPPPA